MEWICKLIYRKSRIFLKELYQHDMKGTETIQNGEVRVSQTFSIKQKGF